MEYKQTAQSIVDRREASAPGSDSNAYPVVQPQIQDHIGRQLRAIYDELLSQPVPDRFTELLETLDREERDKA